MCVCIYSHTLFIVLYAACLVQQSGWTRDLDIFLQWLSLIPFAGGGFSDVATAEGLAEALMVSSVDYASFLLFGFDIFIPRCCAVSQSFLNYI